MATTRKATSRTNTTLKAVLAAKTPAEAARAMNIDPKAFRRYLRSQGVRVRKDRAAFDVKARRAAYAHFAPKGA